MTKVFVAFGVAAAAIVAAAPAEARVTGPVTCARWHHHHCVAWRSRYNVGYVFGPSYAYTDYGALPVPLVSRYDLRPHYRYVHENGYVYVVNPHSYRVTRVIAVPR
jgi:hypothetical protein